MPYYRYTVDGVETPWPDPLPSGVSSNQVTPPLIELTPPLIESPTILDRVMSAPTPSPSPAPASPPHCYDGPLAIPENVANDIRNNDYNSYQLMVNGMSSYYSCYADFYDPQVINAMVVSPVPVLRMDAQMWNAGNPGVPWFIPVTYAGTQKLPDSIPGVTVPQETRPLPAPPVLPIMPAIAPIVQAPLQQAIADIEPIIGQQESLITGQIEQSFDNVTTLIDRLPGRIGDQLVNTMGQIYGVGIGMGLDVPTMEEIETGTVNFNPPVSTPFFYPGKPIPSPTPFPDFIPTVPNPQSCPVPIVNVAPVCPAPPQLQDITFSPIITVNVPAPGMPAPITPIEPVTVNVPAPVVIVPVAPDVIEDDTTPTPSPSPAPTPTPEEPAPVVPVVPPVVPPVAPAVDLIPKPAPLRLPGGVLKPNSTQWEFGAACAIPAQPGAFDSRLLWALFGWDNIGGNEYKPPGWLDPTNWPTGSKSIASFLMNMFGMSIQTLNKVSLASMPITNNIQDFMVLAMGGVVEKWVGAPILPFLQGTIYNINYNNPQILPGIPDLQGLFRKGAISEEIFRCLVRANGSYDSWQMKIAESSTLVPSLYDIIRLYRGKKIGGNEFEYYANLNGLKISTPQGKTDIATFLEATRAIPGVADLVRMMVRDAADDKIAAKYGTDTDLNNKFAGQIESWSEQQGVDPEIMKYFWRAHWEIPSNTQLFDMLHKLRPNRRVGAVPANIVTTADDVKQAIQVNDLTPYWVDRVMATSYSSLTRIDAQRAFFIEAINEDQLYDAYMDIGYNAENAQVLVDFTKELKRKRDSNLPGADKPSNIISQLKKYVISETNAYDRLRATGMKPEQAKKAVSNSVRDRKEEARERCLKEAQRRFFRAEYDLLKYKSVVMQIGIPQENIEALVNETACLYDSRGKELNAGALCKAFSQNIIAFDQFQNRLQLIGYDKDEAYIIAESCQIDKVVAIGKAKLQKEAKERAETEKAKKAEEKAQKDEEKKAEKAEKARLAEEKKKEKEKKAAPLGAETVQPVVR